MYNALTWSKQVNCIAGITPPLHTMSASGLQGKLIAWQLN
jgi:hypothetical protein